MKKPWGLWLTGLSLFLLLTGCSSGSSVPTVRSATDSDAAVSFQGREYPCHINYVNKNTAVLTLKDPETLAGLTFQRSDGVYSLSLGTLVCKNVPLTNRNSAIAVQVLSAFDRISGDPPAFVRQHDSNCYEFSDGDITVLTDAEGHLLSLRSDQLTIDTQ